MDLLARREHARQELVQKLSKRFSGEPELIEEELDKLEQEGLQDNSRLAEAFIRARMNRGQGPVKIRMELRSKGLTDERIQVAMEASEISWRDLAHEVATKKFGEALDYGSDMKMRGRISRFLQQRGFSYEHISDIC